MQSLLHEIRSEIFKFIETPISLILTDRKWYAVSQDPHVRGEWLIYKYGRSHALFHGVRLGNDFLTLDVVQVLLTRKALISRYFIQRLIMQFGPYDEKLIEQKIQHNANQIDFDRIRDFKKKLRSPWASNLPLPIFTKLITEGYNTLSDHGLETKGNDMELFHFLSAGPLVINDAPQKLHQNLSEIEDLILNKKFVPFPPRPKPIFEDTIEYIQLMQARAHEDYPPKDGYENSRQLNVVARAILIHPDLINLWKEIGYHRICSDVNDLVMQGAFLILFPPTPPTNWIIPDIDSVVTRLRQLLAVGFQLTETVMEAAFQLFEHRLDEIGDLLMDSFQNIRKEPKSVIACSCLIQTAKPERKHKKFDLLEFLIKYIDDQPEKAWEKALKHYNVGFKYDIDSIKSVEMRSLSVHSNIYYWILKKYGPNYKITHQCFDDILESRIWIDLKLQENPELDVPEHLTKQAFNSICSIYLEFCKEKFPFKRNYLPYLMMAKDEEIIKPFFKISLPILFGLKLQRNLPYDINHEYDRPKVNYYYKNNNKRKFNEMDCYSDQNELAKLFDELKDNYNGTKAYKIYHEEFMCRYSEKELNDSDFEQPGSSSESLASKKPRHEI
ncbi:uncharacterized protein OCT59_010611 [Rhizophagus irregularis]|nr:hypothetical protein RirG_221330 [Rhizophagus irregularis DAOM 197198w]UZO19314.1 hypothetical protein OCT59_010611 [Rhizophagus irregularis]GBC13266.1 hypothetical protein GLOIN_2v1486262 [Rhizophagus irregularis DAOM 181602=DAOM 197198]